MPTTYELEASLRRLVNAHKLLTLDQAEALTALANAGRAGTAAPAPGSRTP